MQYSSMSWPLPELGAMCSLYNHTFPCPRHLKAMYFVSIHEKLMHRTIHLVALIDDEF